MIEIPFCGASYEMDSIDISSQKTVNLYPETYQDGNTKTVMALRPTAGTTFKALGTGGGLVPIQRGFHLASNGKFFASYGTTVALYDGETDFSPISEGFVLQTGTSPSNNTRVRMADSLDTSDKVNMLVVDGSNTGYIINTTDNIPGFDNLHLWSSVGPSDNYPGGTHVAQIDGYFIVNIPNTLKAGFSAINDATSWGALDTITKEGKTDNITALIAHNGRLLMMGNQSYEWFQTTGNTTNPFLRISGTNKNIGIEAPDSLAENGNAVFWLGSSLQGFGKIYMSQGFDARAISTIPIERAIQGYTSTTDAEAFCFQEDGHDFYQITFPTDNKTWVYDTTTGLWHERSYRDPNMGTALRHRARVQGFFGGVNYFGDFENEAVYASESTVYTDDNGSASNDPILRTRTSPVIWNALERIYYDTFQVDVEVGQGLGTGQGSDPMCMLRWSKDGGYTFTDKRYESLGKIGKYRTRVRWERLGTDRERVWELTCSDPIPFTILNAFVELG